MFGNLQTIIAVETRSSMDTIMHIHTRKLAALIAEALIP